MANTSLKITGLDEAVKLAEDRAARAKDLRPAMAVTAERFKSLIDTTFVTSSSPSGEPWAPLAPSTIRQKTKSGHSLKPLIRSGARGLQGGTSVAANERGLEFRTREPYGVYHQSDAPRKRLPKRPFLPFTGIGTDAPALMRTAKVDAIVEDLRQRVIRWVLRGER